MMNTIDGPGGAKMVTYGFDVESVGPNGPVSDWNAMDINVVDRLSDSDLRFNNVMLNGQPLGDFGTEGWNNWTVTGVDFTQSFTIMGDMVVKGSWISSEQSKLQIAVGCLQEMQMDLKDDHLQKAMPSRTAGMAFFMASLNSRNLQATI